MNNQSKIAAAIFAGMILGATTANANIPTNGSFTVMIPNMSQPAHVISRGGKLFIVNGKHAMVVRKGNNVYIMSKGVTYVTPVKAIMPGSKVPAIALQHRTTKSIAKAFALKKQHLHMSSNARNSNESNKNMDSNRNMANANHRNAARSSR